MRWYCYCYAVGLINSKRYKNTLVSDCLQNHLPKYTETFRPPFTGRCHKSNERSQQRCIVSQLQNIFEDGRRRRIDRPRINSYMKWALFNALYAEQGAGHIPSLILCAHTNVMLWWWICTFICSSSSQQCTVGCSPCSAAPVARLVGILLQEKVVLDGVRKEAGCGLLGDETSLIFA